MNKPFYRVLLLSVLALFNGARSHAAFISKQKISLSASATVKGGGAPIRITAVPLPSSAFSGKHVIIPVEVSSDSGAIDTTNLRIEMLYQMVDPAGTALNPVTAVPIQFFKHPSKPNTLQGTVILTKDNLVGIRKGGHLRYYFHSRQGAGSEGFLSKAGMVSRGVGAGAAAAPSDAFDTTIIDTLTAPVNPEGETISLPDLAETDRPTSIKFPFGSISGRGNLLVKHEDEDAFPLGPNGLKPLAVYTLTLEDGAALVREALITLSYAADISGTVAGTSYSGSDLAIHWLDPYGWRVLGRPQIDTTLHTVTAMTRHFSTFALIPTGPVGAIDSRPQERIITPNGDGKNDKAIFGSVDGDIHLFDIRGRRVKTISAAKSEWDGTDDSGKVVESGIYLYQYMSQGERVSGVIAVAK